MWNDLRHHLTFASDRTPEGDLTATATIQSSNELINGYVGTLAYVNTNDKSMKVNFDLANEVKGLAWKLDLRVAENRGEKFGSLKLETPWPRIEDLMVEYRLNYAGQDKIIRAQIDHNGGQVE